MRIDLFRVHGFGHFANVELALSPALNVVFGPNEAGKSTLLAFVRAVLFGFRRRTDAARYEPARGDFGGELLLATESGPLWVRRVGGRRYEGELTVRAPSGERLSPSALLEALSGISRELFFQVFAFGPDEVASFQKLASQGSVSEALFAAGMRGARRLPQAVQELRNSSEAIFGSSRRAKRELNRVLLELERVQQRLSEIGDRPAQYAQAAAQLEAIDSELQRLEQRAEQLTAERDQLAKLRSAAGFIGQLAAVEARLASLPPLEEFPVDGLARLDELGRQIAQVRAEAEAVECRTAALTRELAAALVPEQLAAREPRLRSEIAEFQSRLEQFRSLPPRRAALAQRQMQLVSKLEQLGMAGELSQLSSLELGDGKEQLLRLRDDTHRLRAAAERAQQEFTSSSAACSEQTLALERLEAQRDRAPAPVASSPRRFPLSWLMASLVLLALFALAAVFAFGSPARVAALSALIAGATFWALQRRAARLEAAETRERLEREIQSGSAARAKLLLQQRLAAEELDAARSSAAAIHRELESFLAAHRLPAGLSAEGAVDLWTELASLQQRAADLESERGLLAADELLCARAAQAVCASAQRAGLGTADPQAAAAALATLLDRVREVQHERRRLSESLHAKREEAARLARGRAALEESVARLLEQGACADEMEFRRRAEQAGAFRGLTQEAGELTLRIEVATGLALACARRALEQRGGLEALLAASRSLASQLSDLIGRKSALSEQRGHLRALLEAWEADAEIRTLRETEEKLRAQAAELSQKYSVDRLALSLLAEARRRHEKDQQPRIIQLASRTFQELTAGRYLQIYASSEEPGSLFVCDSSGRDWPTEALSRGTREQLFFAFRLAVVEEFGEARCPLPVIIDDILVNFDPSRARRAVQTLARLSSRHQVVAFTCHPEVRDLFKSEGARAVEIETRERWPTADAARFAETA